MLKMFLKMLLEPQLNVKDAQDKLDMPTAIVTDCKALFDLIKQVQGQLRWVSSERQLADGLTKIGSRQQFSDARKRGWLQLVDDTSYTASKKKTVQEREASRVSMTSKIASATVALVSAETLKGSDVIEGNGWWPLVYFLTFVFILIIDIDKVVWWMTRSSPTSRTTTTETQSLELHELTEMSEMRHACIHRDMHSAVSRTLSKMSNNKQQKYRTVTSAKASSARTSRKPYMKFKVNEITTSTPGVQKNANP